MPYIVKILKDSLAPCGMRLTTFECTYPRMVHSELMSHREFSRNAASSRAIPVSKIIDRVERDSVIPVWWGKNQKGMQAEVEMNEWEKARALTAWLTAKDDAIAHARELADIGVHKQLVNRVLEPFSYITTIITSNSFNNFFNLRDTWKLGESPGPAQPEIAFFARMMRQVYEKSEPVALNAGQWHLPLVELLDSNNPMYVGPENTENLRKISAARCARISYLTHGGIRDLTKDIELCDSLISNGHWSPLEHVARAENEKISSGNIKGFTQFRKMFDNEYIY